MKFMDMEGIVPSLSNIKPVDFNCQELKDRFNKNFVKNKSIQLVELTFYSDVVVEFIAGFRDSKVLFINKKTKQEFNTKEFSQALNELEMQLIRYEID